MASRTIKQEQDVVSLELGDDFDRSRVRYQQRAEGKGDQVNPMVTETLRYAEKFSNFRSKEAITQAKSLLASDTRGKYQALDPFEIACLNNLNIQTVEEARCLVPSLAFLAERMTQLRQLNTPAPDQVEIPPHTDLDADSLIEELLEDLKRYQSM